MEYIYYIIDLYDFTLYDDLDVMNALGLARCYELYGVFGMFFSMILFLDIEHCL